MNAWKEERGTSQETVSLLQSIFTNISDAVLVVDHSGMIVTVNAAMERISGWSQDELVGKKHICEVCLGMATCQEESTCTDCFFKRSQMPSFEMRLRTKEGREYPVAASSTRLPEGAPGKMVMILRDMTDQQRAEKERYQHKLTNFVIQAQEEERKRISRELHDGVGQALYSILVGLNVLGQSKLSGAMKQHVADVQQLTAKAMEEVKRMALELRPSALDDLGLLPALRSLIKRVEKSFGLTVDLHVQGARRRYQAAMETALYRIVQEAMTNTAKYAQAEKLGIVFEDREKEVVVTIVDDGVGFDVEAAEHRGSGLGLFGMKERAQLLGGSVDVRSAIGEGTTVIVRIPLPKGEAEHGDTRPDR
ncbi:MULTISPECIES: PAS domain-containing sensor histidine kinase [Brevibacillus]|uniref:Sensor histidine kinase n=1 Tax=Brevibacillus borstelensis AK1 TaxID=1300222 RepID=M8D580_9BACL|nr:PAS domain-containing sensor histidine kinase [Brevibacillus borstelensis]EMT51439.1 two-component sensor histidine kinase [Brevibacillus borstelensis AK1]KKX54960.1 histidine kinase [Brevibacillus borstelensis cifa_chp40]MBE5396307.1 PAS domain S-box protein [Brevibacillus borstelensis]MCC0564391.1 PAS domain-containing sensor histidine kinase [Brevibacillus borstelensis]MCM3623807.1 PAS domain-containing sensor histidine kinase [Brevibacillus borstelensis]